MRLLLNKALERAGGLKSKGMDTETVFIPDFLLPLLIEVNADKDGIFAILAQITTEVI